MKSLLSAANGNDNKMIDIIKNNTEYIKKTIEDILSLTPNQRERRFNIENFDESKPLNDAISLISGEFKIAPENILIYKEEPQITKIKPYIDNPTLFDIVPIPTVIAPTISKASPNLTVGGTLLFFLLLILIKLIILYVINILKSQMKSIYLPRYISKYNNESCCCWNWCSRSIFNESTNQ